MEKFIITREVWRPIERCPFKDGETYLAATEDGYVHQVIVANGMFVIPNGKGSKVMTDAVKYIPAPYNELYEVETNAYNDIPTELCINHLLRKNLKLVEEVRALRKELAEREECTLKDEEALALRAQVKDLENRLEVMKDNEEKHRKTIATQVEKLGKYKARLKKVDGLRKMLALFTAMDKRFDDFLSFADDYFDKL